MNNGSLSVSLVICPLVFETQTKQHVFAESISLHCKECARHAEPPVSFAHTRTHLCTSNPMESILGFSGDISSSAQHLLILRCTIVNMLRTHFSGIYFAVYNIQNIRKPNVINLFYSIAEYEQINFNFVDAIIQHFSYVIVEISCLSAVHANR